MLEKDSVLQGRYRILSLLGSGGMGAVYEAIDERFGDSIALKEIIIDLAGLADEKQRESFSKAFAREAKSLAKAKHHAVPYVRDYFSESERQYLVMELVEGEDLAEMLLKRRKPFPLEDILDWMLQLLDALDYLHNLSPRIIHRDIKPQNLKVNARGKVKLLDFGIARSGDKASTLTGHTFVGATLNYSPIEQILRVIEPNFRSLIIQNHKEKAEEVLNQDTDARCDIFSLAACFYHLATNHIPIDATKRTLEIWRGMPDPLPDASSLNPGIPASVSAFLKKAMAIEREGRFRSAIEMQEELQKAISDSRAIESPGPVLAKKEESQGKSPLPSPERDQPQTPDISTLETQPSFPPRADDPSPGLPDTQPSGNISEPEFTAPSYLGDIQSKKKPPEVEIPTSLLIAEDERPLEDYKKLWPIPAALFGILIFGLIGGAIWMNSGGTQPSNRPTINMITASPTPTPTMPEAMPAPPVTPTPTPTPAPPSYPKPTPKPAVKPPPKPKPTAKPKPPDKSGSPDLSDDCVYDNRNCKN